MNGERLSGVETIMLERLRQVRGEGWSDEHDDQHRDESLAQAAAIYAWPDPRPLEITDRWPWDEKWWKPSVRGLAGLGVASDRSPENIAGRIRDLAKAGALIAAEIDRLQRLARKAAR